MKLQLMEQATDASAIAARGGGKSIALPQTDLERCGTSA